MRFPPPSDGQRRLFSTDRPKPIDRNGGFRGVRRPVTPPEPRFEPTVSAAKRRLEQVQPHVYAKTRNFLDGAVTQLSPYLTHGFLNIPGCIEQLCMRYPLTTDSKLIYEFAWREYFHHVWTRIGDGIFSDIRNPIWRGRYNTTLPDDIVRGATGISIIDSSVRDLYRYGYLHNHARMWLASYIVHLRKVDWKVGAQWMYSHLLDGDLASNHLSWQWVAATFAHKPYLFNADNVSRYAFGFDCKNTAIDSSYVDLEAMARGRNDCGPEPGHHIGTEPPATHPNVSALMADHDFSVVDNTALNNWLSHEEIDLIHPWDLGDRPSQSPRRAVGWIDRDFHLRFPWSELRWHFVLKRMRALCDTIWVTSSQEWAQGPARLHSVHYLHTMNPGYMTLNTHRGAIARPQPRFFQNPPQMQQSFTRFFDIAMAGRELSSHLTEPSQNRA